MQQLYNKVCVCAAFTTPARSQETLMNQLHLVIPILHIQHLLELAIIFLTCCEDKAQQMFMGVS